MPRVAALAVACSLLFLAATVLLARARRLQAGYAVFWVATGAGMLALALAPRLLDRLAALLGIAYPPALLFLFGLLFAFGLILHLTSVVSRQAQQIADLAQALALLEARLEDRHPSREEPREGRSP